jgi:hypothetical protein
MAGVAIRQIFWPAMSLCSLQRGGRRGLQVIDRDGLQEVPYGNHSHERAGLRDSQVRGPVLIHECCSSLMHYWHCHNAIFAVLPLC